MVHANELRIGNRLWLRGPDGNELSVVTVSGFTADDTVYVQSGEVTTAHSLKEVRAITITEEILKASGFVQDEIEYIGGLWHLHPVQILDDNGLWLVNDKLRKRLKLHCLHQLQNLYFALSGKELEVEMDNG